MIFPRFPSFYRPLSEASEGYVFTGICGREGGGGKGLSGQGGGDIWSEGGRGCRVRGWWMPDPPSQAQAPTLLRLGKPPDQATTPLRPGTHPHENYGQNAYDTHATGMHSYFIKVLNICI